MPEVGSLQFGIRAVRPYRAWGWTDYASLHTLFNERNHAHRISMTQMAANRRNAQRVSVDSDPPADTATFMAVMNSMVIAMRDSTAAIRESATVTNRATEYMGRRNRKNGNGGDDEEMDNGVGRNNIPITLATFLKINPPSFSGATTVTRADD
ncbi:hypothetical protein PIB30_103685 [Stylosanthes scabra]|uniref:Uncharacterized protein n=1 Tax=Stylosanthes scabra TaxID=79078 RepID=A0ABU6YVU0_9FABA|nr:hypothetical protein [Stylosanthes scabra]